VANVAAFLWSAIFGIATFLLWKFWLYDLTLVDSLLPAVMANAMVFFMAYFFAKKSRAPSDTVQHMPKINYHAEGGVSRGINFLSMLKRLVSNLTESSKNRVELFGAPYGLFVLFSVANFCFIPLIFSHSSGYVTPVFIIYLRMLACCLSFLLIMKDFWPASLVRYLPLYWHVTLFVCLPYFAICMCLFSSCSIEWVIDLVLTNFILGLLVDWRTYIGGVILGLVLATSSFVLFGDLHQFDPNIGNFPIMSYAIGVSLLAGAIFSRSKERALMEKLVTFKALGGTIAHEMRTPLSSIHISATGLIECVPALVEGYERAKSAGIKVPHISPLALESLATAPERMRYICANTLNVIDMLLLQLRAEDWTSHFADCSILDCLNIALAEYSFRPKERELVEQSGVIDFSFYGNQHLVVHILYNLMRNSFSFIESEKKGKITIWTSESLQWKNLHFRDTAKGINREDLPHIFEHGFSKRNAGSGVGLHYCKKMMLIMSGQINAVSTEGAFTEFVLSFPHQR
ncbi:MAG TPA: HAMP domain-containing sensor histidine kinase, partial [Myxococcota bacterium]|nr:HAMP domain-containing sensor histidine kinase [Myxococcota bacterium]